MALAKCFCQAMVLLFFQEEKSIKKDLIKRLHRTIRNASHD